MHTRICLRILSAQHCNDTLLLCSDIFITQFILFLHLLKLICLHTLLLLSVQMRWCV